MIAGCPARVQRVVSFVANPSAREELYGNATGDGDGVEDAGDGGVGSGTSRQRELVWSRSEGRGKRDERREEGEGMRHLHTHTPTYKIIHPQTRTGGDVSEADVGKRVAVVGYDCEGVLRFFGQHHKTGRARCGVALDERIGRNNGTVAGHRYFTCEDGHGVLCTPHKVTVLEA